MDMVRERILPVLEALRPSVDAHITLERVRRYCFAIADTPAPSTAAAAMRTPVLKRLLSGDGALPQAGLHLKENFENTGSTVILTGDDRLAKPVWYFAHLDTISYLIQPRQGDRHPLVPFCYHLIEEGSRPAEVYRYDLAGNGYRRVGTGQLVTSDGEPFFHPDDPGQPIRVGDRVVMVAPCRDLNEQGDFVGHVDNAGAVAALAVAAPVMAAAGIEAMLAFPDEEEGPRGTGSQVMGRGGTRIVNLLPVPEIAIIADVQQAGGDAHADTRGGVENSTRLGQGAVLAEFSSLARGAVTPPHLYVLAQAFIEILDGLGVPVQESNNAYTSRSDDVSVLLKTPNILLLGFAGFNRHLDKGEPRANLHDLVSLSKALVYYSAIAPLYRELSAMLHGRTA
ncbi:hypothetical protein [Geminicoccus roseus]|uniref:hypothetical protein n=1 Tax=Geminicoccus roseus TaxID=404900 RepID=UPI00041EE091|nr:hypothetical protein [Geminicoccus roseus]